MDKKIFESRKLLNEIEKLLTERQFNLDDRKTVSVGSLSSSLEYFSGIFILFEKKKYGAGSALLRSQFESYVKGTWFLHCSTDRQIEHAYTDTFNKDFHKIISGLEHSKAPGWENIKYIKNSYWSIMCGYTHTGKHQLARRFKDFNIQPNYDISFLQSVLTLADFIAFNTALELFEISTGPNINNKIKAIYESNRFLTKILSNIIYAPSTPPL